MSELITTSSAYIINGDSPMTSVANTVAMTTFAVHTLQPLIFYRNREIRSAETENRPAGPTIVRRTLRISSRPSQRQVEVLYTVGAARGIIRSTQSCQIPIFIQVYLLYGFLVCRYARSLNLVARQNTATYTACAGAWGSPDSSGLKTLRTSSWP